MLGNICGGVVHDTSNIQTVRKRTIDRLETSRSNVRPLVQSGCGLLFDQPPLIVWTLPVFEEIFGLVQPTEGDRAEQHSGRPIVDSAVRRPRVAVIAPFDLEKKVAIFVMADELHHSVCEVNGSAAISDNSL